MSLGGHVIDGVWWRVGLWAKHTATGAERRVSGVTADGVLHFHQTIKSGGETFYWSTAGECTIAWWRE